MKKIILATIILSLLFTSCDYVVVNKKEVTEYVEQAYFEGQRDYAMNDKRIEWTKDSCWVWIKSPWDNGTAPIYNPSLIHSKTGK